MSYTILHTESSPGWGGQENRILKESIGLQAAGHRLIIAAPPGSTLIKRAREKGIETIPIPMRKSYDIPAIMKLLKIIRQERVDIINTHSGKDSFLGAIAGRLSPRRPVIVRTRHLALPITSLFTYRNLPHCIITVSRYVRDYLVSIGVPEHKVFAVPTGIDTEVFNPAYYDKRFRVELGITDDTPLVGTVGILRKKKGHHILLEAIPEILKEFPEARFVFVGDGPQWGNLQRMIHERGLGGKVIMLGRRRDIPEILSSLDLFVLPTLQEALGTAFLEAMAMEKPVIGCDVDGVKEVIEDGKTGLLVSPNSPSLLRDAIIKLLTFRERGAELGREGRKRVLREFTLEKMCEGMIRVYDNITALVSNGRRAGKR